MSERAGQQPPEPLYRPTPRQLVIRSIGTLLALAVIVAAVLVVIDRRSEPTDVTDLVREPRTVSYSQLSLQIPADWTDLAFVDDCGFVQGDTLILGLAGVVRCDEGERDPEASDVVMSSLTGETAAPAPAVRLRPVTLPSGLRAQRGSTVVPDPASGGGGQAGDEEDADGDEDREDPPLRTTVLAVPSLDVQVVATSRDRQLVKGILNSARRIPSVSRATTTVAYLFAALDLPRGWQVNAVECGVPVADTVVLGKVWGPQTTPRRGTCSPERPRGVTEITMEALDSGFGRRWGPLANDPVTLLNGVKGLRGRKVLPRSGMTVTVVLVPTLRTLAVARTADTALADQVLSTMHRAVPAPPERDEPTPTTTPSPTPDATLPAGVKTRAVRYRGLTLSVPVRWATDAFRCGEPLRDTVGLGAPPDGGPGCGVSRPNNASALVIDRLYGGYGARWRGAADEATTLPSGLSGLLGSSRTREGLPVTVLTFPTIDAIIVATAANDGDAQDLIDGILTTARAPALRPPP
jgi:hypothetical protein